MLYNWTNVNTNEHKKHIFLGMFVFSGEIQVNVLAFGYISPQGSLLKSSLLTAVYPLPKLIMCTKNAKHCLEGTFSFPKPGLKLQWYRPMVDPNNFIFTLKQKQRWLFSYSFPHISPEALVELQILNEDIIKCI